jgi:DNA helicase-4
MKTGTGQCSVCQAQTATLSPSAQSSDTSDLGTSPHSAEPCSSFDELHFNLTNAKQFALILLRKRRYARMRIAGYILLPIVIGVLLVTYSTRKLKHLKMAMDDLEEKARYEISENNLQVHRLAVGPLTRYPTYLVWSTKDHLLKQFHEYHQTLESLKERSLPVSCAREVNDSIDGVASTLVSIETYNDRFIAKRKRDYHYLFRKAAVPIDDAQQSSIIIDDHHNFVIAGAGSGKTEVLTNRIAYLVLRKPDTIRPNRVLALAFQHNAAQEIDERLRDRFDIHDVNVKTFHALGLEILRTAGLPTQLKFDSDNSYTQFIRELYEKSTKRPEFLSLIVEYMKNYEPTSTKQRTDFETKEEYFEYMRNQSYAALNGTKVKSEAEKAIMNFFLTHRLNGKEIKIQYETAATWMRYRNEKNQLITPRPDFHLPEFDIYIEHWAIDAEGQAPEWFKNPEHYKNSMNKKKEAYNLHAKRLVETTSAEYYRASFESVLEAKVIQELKDIFQTNTFVFSPIPYEELIERVYYELRSSVRELPYQISQFIMIAKTYALGSDKIRARLTKEKWSRQQIAFGRIAVGIFEDYESALRDSNEIDFADMINLAVKQLEDDHGLYRDVFDHVLVDEYQDLSTQRYRLLKALLDKNHNCKLFAVGDDWQSIMGFAGSNLDFSLRFADYFDHPAITHLNTNYRSVKSIVDLGAAVISHNKSHIPKDAVAKSTVTPSVMLHMSSADKYHWTEYYAQVADHCMSKVREYLDKGYQPSDIMILVRIARNPRLINTLFETARGKGIKVATSRNNPRAVPIISVHKSKGLQARAVFLLNVIDHMYGFPCTVEDLDLFAPASEGIPRPREEEERRLFYVAITRTKENLTVYSQNCRVSKFIIEVRDHLTLDTLGEPPGDKATV